MFGLTKRNSCPARIGNLRFAQQRSSGVPVHHSAENFFLKDIIMFAAWKLARPLVFIWVILLLSSCIGTQATGNQALTMVKVLTSGNDTETTPPISVEVGNCNGFPDHKIEECTAGSENNITLTAGGSVGNTIVSFDPSVSTQLGFTTGITQSIALDPPPSGFIYQYTITTTYQIIAGNALVQSSDGKQETAQYRYHASCSINKSVPEIKNCQGTTIASPVSPSPVSSTLGIGSFMISDKDGMKLLYVPAGQFTMGSNDGPSDEQPVHMVYLDAFWIDQTDVTNAMYAKCVNVGACQQPVNLSSFTRSSYYGNSQFDNYPVINVNWYMANTYCQWAGQRLPTEAQWEKAARGTDRRTYPWGNDTPNDSLLNYKSSVGDTTEVGKYPNGASPYGALDMAGDVWQWVADWYSHTYYQSSPSSNPLGPNVGDPLGPDMGTDPVLRGGAWNTLDQSVRSTSRSSESSGLIGDHPDILGFRCARSQ
jgi:formylglycine-generating enzyme required for sulfatase activity